MCVCARACVCVFVCACVQRLRYAHAECERRRGCVQRLLHDNMDNQSLLLKIQRTPQTSPPDTFRHTQTRLSHFLSPLNTHARTHIRARTHTHQIHISLSHTHTPAGWLRARPVPSFLGASKETHRKVSHRRNSPQSDSTKLNRKS